MKSYALKLVLICIAILGFNSCKEDTKVSSEKVVVSFKKEGILKLIKADTTVLKTLDIEIADNDYETQTGLMYRKHLNANHGMLFIFPDENYRSFYMKNTQIALDIIYINSDKTIVSIQKNAKPFNETSLPSEQPAMYVLEVNAGLSDTWGLKVGDTVSYEIL